MYRVGEKAQQTQDVRNSGVLRSWIQRWVQASYANYDQIEKELVRDKKGYSLLKHQAKHVGEPAIIIGAGMSLKRLIPLLKDWEGVIFAPESMASTLTYYGHQPEYICLFDAGQTAWDLFLKGYNWKGSTLITHPSVDPKVIECWKWDKIYYLMMHFSKLTAKIEQEGKSLIEIERDVKNQLLGFDFFENILPMVYEMIGASIMNAGCVINNAIEVANFMGFGPLFLCGVDYGFKDWINRFPSVHKVKGRLFSKWVKDEIGYLIHEVEGKEIGDCPAGREIIISDNGIPTTDEQAEYKLALMCVYKLDRPQLFDCSDGIITELPKLNIEEVVKKNGRGFEKQYRTNEDIIRNADAYFNRR
jgi:hypothetical protein